MSDEKKEKLLCEDPENCDYALREFNKQLARRGQYQEGLTYTAAFEHGQIFIICNEEPFSWSANDAEDQYGDFYWSFEQL